MSKHLNFGWVGDSITEGYADVVTVSCYGVPGRFLRYSINTVGAPSATHQNMGVSGRRVNQYIDVATSIIDADPTRFSAILTSVWSPNKPTDQPAGAWPTSAENLADMLSWLESFESWLLNRNIVFIPTFMAGSYSAITTENRIALQGYLNQCISKWPWLLNFNEPIQDPAYTDGPRMASPTYCNDGIHPNTAGYDAQYTWGSTRLIPAFEQACAAYGFVEA